MSDYLTPDEREEYAKYLESGRPSMSPATAIKMFELFVQGVPCRDIAKLNPGFPLGMILKARVDHKWDSMREEHLAGLYRDASTRMRQTVMESAQFLGDLLAAAHKQHGEKVRKFLQSGDEKDLGDFTIGSLKQYKEAIETLAKLTGADNKKTVEHRGQITTVQAEALPQPAIHQDPGVTSKLLKAILDDELKGKK